MSNNEKIHINKLTIIGVGLIGGSLARALKHANAVDHVVGCGRNADSLETAVKLGVIDSYTTEPAEAVVDADVIVLATPLITTEDLIRKMHPNIKTDAIITDVGSAKGSVVAAAKNVLNDLTRFVPGHPIAGTEKSGVEASFAELFDAHRVILTPIKETDKEATDFITRMWQLTGADVVTMDINKHDQVLAATSHLPHMLAYALVDCLSGMDESEEIFSNAAGGFADFTRIASSSPQMWHDICYSNRESLLRVLEQFDQHLGRIKLAIENDNSAELLELFTRAKQQRDAFLDQRKNRKDACE